MNNKYNIEFNRPKLSKSDIESTKNFKDVLSKVNAQPTSLLQKMLGSKTVIGLASVAVIATLATFYLNQEASQQTKQELSAPQSEELVSTKETKTINPPIKEFDIPYEVFDVNASEDIKLLSKKGSRIFIPKNSLIDHKGELVKGNIQVKFREFHHPVEVFLSGIPMNYDSAGVENTFETAGMFEIRAVKDSLDLAVKNSKQVKVELVSHNEDSKFNFYALDEQNGTWEFKNNKTDMIKPKRLEVDTLVVEEAVSELEEVESISINDLASQKISYTKPRLQNPDKYAFKVDFDKMKCPELGLSNKYLFEVNDQKCNFDPMYYSVNWDRIEISSHHGQGEYTVLLQEKDTSIKVIANAVLNPEEYKKAMISYKRTKKDLVTQRKRHESQANFEVLETSSFTRSNNANDPSLNKMRSFAFANTKPPLRVVFRRAVSVATLGVYNWDYPIPPYTKGPEIAMNFDVRAKEKIASMYSYSKGKKVTNVNPVRSNRAKVKIPKGESIVWGVSTEGKLFVSQAYKTRKYFQDNGLVLLDDFHANERAVQVLFDRIGVELWKN